MVAPRAQLSTALGACAALLLLLLVTLAVSAVVLKRKHSTLGELNRDLDKTIRALDDTITVLDHTNTELVASVSAEELARCRAEELQQLAEENLATTYFWHGHTLCDNGQVPAGLAYLAESLVLAERAPGLAPSANPLASAIRLSLATWRHKLHDLRAVLPHQLKGEHHQVQSVVVDRNGRFAITVSRSEGGTWLWWWDLRSEPPRRLLEPIKTEESVDAVALADDSSTIATVGAAPDGGSTIRLWRYDETGGRPEVAWRTDEHLLYQTIGFAPDGKTVVAAGRDGDAGIVQAWSVGTREVVRTYYEGSSIPQCVAYSHDGRYLAVGTDDTGRGLASLWVYTTSGEARWGCEAEGAVCDVTFSRDDRWLAAAISTALKGEVQVRSARSGEPRGRPLMHLSEVKSVEFSPDGEFILTGSLDRTARLWDVTTCRLLEHPMWHEQEVLDVAFVSSGVADAERSSSLLTVSDDAVQMWNVAMGTPFLPDRVEPTVLAGAKIRAEHESDPARLAVAGTMGLAGKTRVLQLRASSSDEPPGRDTFARNPVNWPEMKDEPVYRHDHAATCVAAGGTWGVVGLESGRVLRVNWETGDEHVLSKRHARNAVCAAVSSDDVYAATAGEDGVILVWELERGKFVRQILHPTAGHIRALAFDPLQTNRMLIADADGQVTFRDCVTGESLDDRLSHSASATCAAYSEDGKTLAVGLVGGGQIWRRTSAALAWDAGAQLEGESETLRIVVWEQEQRQLVATGDLQGNVRFWHSGTGEPIGPPLPNQGMVTVLIGLKQDILTVTSSGSIRQWPLPQRTNVGAGLLKDWSEAATGVRLSEQQSVERLDAEAWQAAKRRLEQSGQLDIDRLNVLLRQRYGQPVPRLRRVPGESTEHRSMLQDRLQTTLTETPRFCSLPLEYFDRYLPSDTEALIGFDWRQVVAAPLVWLVTMSHRNFLFEMIQWKELMDICDVHPLLDIQYVLLAAPRHAISPGVLQGQLPGLTVLLKAEFDTEQLRSVVRLAAESFSDQLRIEERTDGERILVYQHNDKSHTVHIAIIEEGDGGTLVGSLDRAVVERALDGAPTDRLEPEFRSCLENTDRNQSLWFVARKSLVHPDSFARFEPWLGLPERVQGGATVFTHWEYSVHATYPDAQALQTVMDEQRLLIALWAVQIWIQKVMPGLAVNNVLSPSADATAEESELLIRGDNFKAIMDWTGDAATGLSATWPAIIRPLHSRSRDPSQPEKELTLPAGYRIAGEKPTRNGRLFRIRIEEPGEPLPDGDQLMAVWSHIYNSRVSPSPPKLWRFIVGQRQPQVNRSLILNFYLPEMPLDGDPWAVVRQHGKLGIKVTIYTENTPPKYRPK